MAILMITVVSFIIWALLSFLFFSLGLSSINVPLIDYIDKKAYILVELFDCFGALVVLELGLYLAVLFVSLLLFLVI